MNINLQAIPMKENQTTILRSSLAPAVMRRALWRGTLIGGVGIGCLVVGGTFIPAEQMIKWGLLLFISSFALMTWGLLPYKRLKRLEESPYILTVDGENKLHFSTKGKQLFNMPISSIDHIFYIDKKKMYGIGISFKDPSIGAHFPKVPSPHLNELPPCDLFLPYFSRRSFAVLQERLHD